MMKKKCSSGRQRIPIEKIPKKSHLQVTFSKRRSGLFKKASELCTLCGVEIAIIVFSPADKAFSFGHPQVESVVDSYVTSNSSPEYNRSGNGHQLVEAHRSANIRNLNAQLTQIVNELEIEKRRGEELDRAWKTRLSQFWWEIPLNELGLQELQHLMFSLHELKNTIAKYATQIISMDQTTIGPTVIESGSNGFIPEPYYIFDTKHTNAEIYGNTLSLSFPY
ncbi:agamous-like MADS-box protein AGL61 [Vigna radiata var. radiata]|uniref:Agamous-like MADS-box protein AGL61 n=1 Tax=Vigna radiata var. radiata TaxID=3916 RepID=A0A1S3VMC8_VIGRR|nr:agamous-like MADS-box protein AGL61 [Vigna radiata var. radiata]